KSFFCERVDAFRILLSFPTRRSSDLMAVGTAIGVTCMNAFAGGSIQKWMLAGSDKGVDQLITGFRSFYWLMVFLTILMIVYLMRSEEHTSELQSRENIVCRLLLEKKK